MSRRDDRGFWTCHATVAAVGSTGLAAMLRHINHLNHKSDTQRDDGRSAQTTYGELAKPESTDAERPWGWNKG